MPARRIDKVWALALLGGVAGCAVPDTAIDAVAATWDVAPGPYTFARVSVQVVAEPGHLVATTLDAEVDPRALPEKATGLLDIETLAPFLVKVDSATGRVVPGPIVLPTSAWPLIAGQRVRVDGRPGRVAQTQGARVVVVPEAG